MPKGKEKTPLMHRFAMLDKTGKTRLTCEAPGMWRARLQFKRQRKDNPVPDGWTIVNRGPVTGATPSTPVKPAAQLFKIGDIVTGERSFDRMQMKGQVIEIDPDSKDGYNTRISTDYGACWLHPKTVKLAEPEKIVAGEIHAGGSKASDFLNIIPMTAIVPGDIIMGDTMEKMARVGRVLEVEPMGYRIRTGDGSQETVGRGTAKLIRKAEPADPIQLLLAEAHDALKEAHQERDQARKERDEVQAKLKATEKVELLRMTFYRAGNEMEIKRDVTEAGQSLNQDAQIALIALAMDSITDLTRTCAGTTIETV